MLVYITIWLIVLGFRTLRRAPPGRHYADGGVPGGRDEGHPQRFPGIRQQNALVT